MKDGWRRVLRQDPCVYCCVWPMPQRAWDVMSIEHVVPRLVGGRHQDNRVAAHQSCNQDRRAAPLLWYLLYRQRVQTLRGRQYKPERRALRRQLALMSEGRAPAARASRPDAAPPRRRR